MRTKILLAEDDSDFGLILKQYLELSDFDVFWYQNPEDVMSLLKEDFSFHIGILDIMMPNIDGFTLAKEILKQKPEFPVLFLTAKNQKIDRITGLKLGADDYLAKPCDPEELILRIQNILKRIQPIRTISSIKIGEYSLDTDKLLLNHSKEDARMTQRELDLLLFLLQHNHQTIKREIILDHLWETNDYFSGRSLDVFISRLRKYFQHDERIKIQSLRGIGFQLDFPD
ncbi:two-component system response regulator [Elizabethkingia meningoseptica]|uniref:DNA-binding response regulator n=1 Tax=Elizabethkingia meningoseptica TaxID=238 RepID=A0A1V3TYH1_ELIME|nr:MULTISPECIES: response regulator transcription factor [Elizabethkingia]AQX13294.1 two-component system response regulator [Elizabethkingia meningoseptica]EJK5329020.1 response regulator transcription factor [Elizabethkingia meningoseptica]MBG0514925.1 response regulator transcription factor [Elizabethkingia meningoseptica]MDE5433761.1 response regulator transcription factor [Elizabethkingia meningoseptica]MDE5450467.1 response regulator transcription factor [Elizabethkingia meningoseptica]